MNCFNRKGRVYCYFRHKDVSVRLPGEPGDAEFMRRYVELLEMAGSPLRSRSLPHGTINWLVTEYRASPKFLKLRPHTQYLYGRMLDMLQPVGHFQVAAIKRAHLQEIRKKLYDRPRTADEFAKVMSILFGFGVDLGVVEKSPAERMAKMHTSEAFAAWTDSEIAAFLEKCEPGPIRTAFMLALHTGQRRGDILRMAWNAFDGTHITVRQQKTKVPLRIRAHSALVAHLSSQDRESLLIVPSPKSAKWDERNFSKAFRAALDAMGLDHLHFHGLRHTAGRMLAEAGCSESEIAAILGHKSLEMVQHYTRQAAQERLGDAAIMRLEGKKRP